MAEFTIDFNIMPPASLGIVCPADNSRRGWVFSAVCLCVCLSAQYLKYHQTWRTNVPRWVPQTYLFWVKRSRSWVTDRIVVSVGLYTLVSAGCLYNVSLEKRYTWLLIITSANVDRFSKLFLWQIPKEIVHVTITVSSTSPYQCCYTTLRNSQCSLSLATWSVLVVADVIILSGEKLKLVTVLIHELLTTTIARGWIHDCAKRLVTAQRHLRCHQLADQRRSRDETQFWLVGRHFNILWWPVVDRCHYCSVCEGIMFSVCRVYSSVCLDRQILLPWYHMCGLSRLDET